MEDLDRWISIAKECKYLPENDLKVSILQNIHVCFLNKKFGVLACLGEASGDRLMFNAGQKYIVSLVLFLITEAVRYRM